MAIPATLINDDRSAERFQVELDATVRNAAARPYDVVVEDLSATGFRMVGSPAMTVGDRMSIGFAGIGVQPARLTRMHADSYGCEFVRPLSLAELSTALRAAPVEPIAFPTLPTRAWLADAPEPHVEPYSPQTKLALAIIVPATLWAVIAGIFWAS
jgi:hypothetical protein